MENTNKHRTEKKMVISEAEFRDTLDGLMIASAAEAVTKGKKDDALDCLRALASVRPDAAKFIQDYSPDLYRFYLGYQSQENRSL
jgi:hypothetical protein